MKRKFLRSPRLKKLGDKWRRPRGLHSKLRVGKKSKGRVPSPGFGKRKKGRHPSGFYEVLIRGKRDLGNVDPKKNVVRLKSSLGKRKRLEIIEKCKGKKIKVLNPGKLIDREKAGKPVKRKSTKKTRESAKAGKGRRKTRRKKKSRNVRKPKKKTKRKSAKSKKSSRKKSTGKRKGKSTGRRSGTRK